jgi:hypothetical protein
VHPIAISFDAAIPIAVVGLMVDIASVWLLSGGSIVITGTGAVTMTTTRKKLAASTLATAYSCSMSSRPGCRPAFTSTSRALKTRGRRSNLEAFKRCGRMVPASGLVTLTGDLRFRKF